MKSLARLLLILSLIGTWSTCFAQSSAEGEYRLGAGDSIRILVFQNPELTLESRIAENGVISYPLLGSVNIGGKTVVEAERQIARALESGGFVLKPQVTIALAQIRSAQVSVLGQITRPGRYPLETANLKVSDLIALAGGPSATGSDVVILSGTRDGKPFKREIDLPLALLGQNGQEDLPVQGGDILFVNRAPMFYVYGEAQRPGSYRLERNMTVQQALATAGGISTRGMELWLKLDRKQADGSTIQLAPGRFDLVLPDDVIYVRESPF